MPVIKLTTSSELTSPSDLSSLYIKRCSNLLVMFPFLLLSQVVNYTHSSLREKYGEMRCISPYSVQMREIQTRKNSVFWRFSGSAYYSKSLIIWVSCNYNILILGQRVLIVFSSELAKIANGWCSKNAKTWKVST